MRYICDNCGNTLETFEIGKPIEGGFSAEISVKLCANCVEVIHQEAFDEGLRSAERLAQDLELSKQERLLPQIHFHLHVEGKKL